MSQEVHQSLVDREQCRRENALMDDIVGSLVEVNTLVNARYRELGQAKFMHGATTEEVDILTDELKKLYGVSDKAFQLSQMLDLIRRERELRKAQEHICVSTSIVVASVVAIALILKGK